MHLISMASLIFQSPHLGLWIQVCFDVCFQCFGVNGMPKWREISSFYIHMSCNISQLHQLTSISQQPNRQPSFFYGIHVFIYIIALQIHVFLIFDAKFIHVELR